VHDYHEKNEEEQVFPRFKTAGRMVELITVLQAQHGACRKLTERVLDLAPKSAVKAEREQLVEAMQATMTLYRPHAAREDTDVFPTLRSLVTPNEFEQIGEALEKSETEKFGADSIAPPRCLTSADSSSRRAYHPVVPTTTGQPAAAQARMLSGAASGCVNSIATCAPASASFVTPR